jgi:hypothetical protein
MSKRRLTVTLPETLVGQLADAASVAGVSTSRLVEHLVQNGNWDAAVADLRKDEG